MNFLTNCDRSGSNQVPSIRDLQFNRTNTFFSSDYEEVNDDIPSEGFDDQNVVCGIFIEKYKPIEELTQYGQYFVSPNTGAYNLTPPLPQHIADYIREFHSDADLSLWDGTLGTYGRNYLSHRPSSASCNKNDRIMNIDELEQLRNRYMQLVVDITPRAVLTKLRKNLEKQTGIQSKLEESIAELEAKIEKLNKQKERLEMNNDYSLQNNNLDNGVNKSSENINETLNLMDDKLIYSNDELSTLLKVNKQLKQKILQIEFEINERETGHLRKIALLRKIFGEEPLIGGLILKFNKNKNPEVLADQIYHYDMLSMKCSRLLFQIKCFYLDCLHGKSLLYKIETSLKSILENLQMIMESMTSTYHHNHYSLIHLPSWSKAHSMHSSGNDQKTQIKEFSAFRKLNSAKVEVAKTGRKPFSPSSIFSRMNSTSNNQGFGNGRDSDTGNKENSNPNKVLSSASLDTDDDSLSSIVDTHSSSHRITSGERDFRLRYVRKVWNTIEGEFRLVHQYIEKTSLPIASKLYHDQGSSGHEEAIGNGEENVMALTRESSKTMTLGLHRMLSSSSGSSTACANREYGIFQAASTDSEGGLHKTASNNVNVLPRFATIELTHALNKRGKIASLYKHAAKVYKQVNLIYDVHNDMVEKSLELLQKRTMQDRQANSNLIRKWEELLRVTTE